MSANHKNESKKPREFRFASDFKSIYTNFVQTAAGPADISIMVGEAMPTVSGTPDVEMKARLVVAPLQAKVVLAMLVQVIQQYEKAYGEITIPEVITKQIPGFPGINISKQEGAKSTEGV